MTKLRYILITLVALWLAASACAQTDPSENPALKDYRQLQKFREVFYPLYTKFLPVRDYGALLGAAPVLETAAREYSEMVYKTHNNEKHRAFAKHRDSLSVLVQAYVELALQFDSTGVCKLVLSIQEQLEQSADALIPYAWPEYSQLRSSVEDLTAYVLRKNDDEKKWSKFDPVRVVDTIVARMATFSASTGPQQVQYRAPLISEEKAYYTELANSLKVLVNSNDRDRFRQTVMDLQTRLVKFEYLYLQ